MFVDRITAQAAVKISLDKLTTLEQRRARTAAATAAIWDRLPGMAAAAGRANGARHRNLPPKESAELVAEMIRRLRLPSRPGFPDMPRFEVTVIEMEPEK
jgi:hypothetical protein